MHPTSTPRRGGPRGERAPRRPGAQRALPERLRLPDRVRLPTRAGAAGARLAQVRASPTARRAARSRALALVVAASVAVTVSAAMARAESEASRWGASTEVVVAAEPLEVGAAIDASTTRIESRPVALVPDGALETVPEGQRVSAPIAAGEVLVATRVAAPGRGPTGSGLGPTDALLAVPVDATSSLPSRNDSASLVQVGDVVDLYGSNPADVAGSTSLVAGAAVATTVETDRVVLRIRRSDAAAGAGAVLAGPTTMVVVG